MTKKKTAVKKTAREQVADIRERAEALLARRHRVEFRGVKVDVAEPSRAMMLRVRDAEGTGDDIVFRESVYAPGTDDLVWADATEDYIGKLPDQLVSKVIGAFLQSYSQEAEETIRGNSDSTGGDS